MATVGIAPHTYEVVEGWGKLPDGWTYREAAAVGVDSKDNVYVFSRGEHPIIVYDRDGNFLRSWGEDLFVRAHGITMGPDDTIYCTDDDDHTVRKCTLDGRVLLTLGVPGQPTPFMSGDPFNKCTHVALDPDNGDIYVADGYRNAKVHKYSPDGKLLFSWGGPGTGPSEFNIVHNIATDRDGWVYVADRENHRIQVFDRNGRYETQWTNMSRPCGLYIDPNESQTVYVGEFGSAIALNAEAPKSGSPRVPDGHSRQYPRPLGRRPHQRGCWPLHRPPRRIGRLPRQHLRGRGLLDHLRPPPQSTPRSSHPPEAGTGELRQDWWQPTSHSHPSPLR